MGTDNNTPLNKTGYQMDYFMVIGSTEYSYFSSNDEAVILTTSPFHWTEILCQTYSPVSQLFFPQCRYMEHGLEYIPFYLKKHMASLAICCNPLVRDKPLGVPEFVILLYSRVMSIIPSRNYSHIKYLLTFHEYFVNLADTPVRSALICVVYVSAWSSSASIPRHHILFSDW